LELQWIHGIEATKNSYKGRHSARQWNNFHSINSTLNEVTKAWGLYHLAFNIDISYLQKLSRIYLIGMFLAIDWKIEIDLIQLNFARGKASRPQGGAFG
jgi:hypothetical protein